MMTRDEAIDAVRAVLYPPGSAVPCERGEGPEAVAIRLKLIAAQHVDIAVALGMLNLTQPKTLAQKITECLCGPFELSAAIRIQDMLHNAGLKIVEK